MKYTQEGNNNLNENRYLNLLRKILDNGTIKKDRTGTGTLSMFGEQLKLNISNSLPLLTTKKININNIIYELLWFLKGDTNIKYLNDNDVHIWDPWANEQGELGPIYGYQWRSWPTSNGESIDQINKIIEDIKKESYSRRLIASAWNVSLLNKMALVPCHLLFQFYVVDNKLSCQVYQRSCDSFIGLPYNIVSYALLTMMIAQQTNLKPDKLIFSFGDIHIYQNHIDQVKIQLSREVLSAPDIVIEKADNIDNYIIDNFKLINYKHHSFIKASIAI